MFKRSVFRGVLIALALGVIPACEKPTVRIAVDVSNPPTFTLSGGRIIKFDVTDFPCERCDGMPRWSIRSSGELVESITYGNLPPGFEGEWGLPLVEGKKYQVTVYSSDHATGNLDFWVGKPAKNRLYVWE